MDLTELVQQITSYFEDSSDLTDVVVIRAINSARKAAEIQHAFELNKKVLQASVDLRIGGTWLSLPEVGTVAPLYDVRNIKRAYTLADDGGLTEVRFAYREHARFNEQDPWLSTDDSQSHNQRLYILGPKIYFWPFGETGTLRNLALDAYVWIADYPYEGPPPQDDWFLKHGHEYLFWKSVWDLNFKKKEFVPRQEGNLQVSLDNAMAAMQRLISWDGQMKGGMTSLNELM